MKRGIGYIAAPLVFALLAACQSRVERLYQKAEQLLRSSQYEKAVVLYEQVFFKHPEDRLAESAIFEAANIHYHHLRHINRAVELYQKLLAVYPVSQYTPQVYLKLGQIYESEIGDVRQAIRAWEQIPNTSSNGGGDYLEVRLKIADGYFKLNEFDKALLEYQKIVPHRKTHAADKANLKIGAIYQMLRKYESALPPLLQVAENTTCDQCRYAAQVQLIDTYENLEEFDKALDMAKKIDPTISANGFKEKEVARLSKKKQKINGSL